MAGIGGMPGQPSVMRNGSLASGNMMQPPQDAKLELPTLIYDYFIKEKHFDLAQQMLDTNGLTVKTKPRPKNSPASQTNGLDMNAEQKTRLENMPAPSSPYADLSTDQSYLQDWWCLFWDMYKAGHQENKAGGVHAQYISLAKQSQMMHQQQRQLMIQNGVSMNSMQNMGPYRNMMNGGMSNAVTNDLRLTAMGNNNLTRNGAVGMQLLPGQLPGNRNPGELDMGQRPQSPLSSGDNAPSPKRQRLDAGQPNMGPGSRMPNGAPTPAMMIDANKQMMANRGMMMGSEGMKSSMSPMISGIDQMQPPFDGNGTNISQRQPQGINPQNQQTQPGQGGALADYQMQLMLLEQQNKKRLMLARQEQVNGGVETNGSQLMLGQGQFAPGMSPHGSRNGNSPGNEQIKRTASTTGASPQLDGVGPLTRGSPIPGNFDPHVMQSNLGMFPQMTSMMPGPGGQIMRVPMPHPGMNGQMSHQQADFLRKSQGGPPGSWAAGGPQMVQRQMAQGEGGSLRNPMAPPAPQGVNAPARTNPSSPQQPVAPPTPSQSNKANSKAKKESKETKKKGPKKAPPPTGVTPSSEKNSPPTPTPPTPTTSVAPNNPFRTSNGSNMNAQNVNANGIQVPSSMASQQDSAANGAPFGNLGGDYLDADGINLDFPRDMDNAEIIEGFDFDSYLHLDPGGFDPSTFDPNSFMGNDDGGLGADS